MPKAEEFQVVAPNLVTWSAYSPEHKTDLCSTVYIHKGSLILIDPIAIADDAWNDLLKLGQPGAILLTNANHLRDAAAFRAKCRIPVAASVDARHELGKEIDVVIIGNEIIHGLRPIGIPGAGVGETAFLSEDGVLAIGDAVINAGGELQWLPDKYCVNGKQNRESAQKLSTLSFHTLTFAHGLPVTQNAKAKFSALIGS